MVRTYTGPIYDGDGHVLENKEGIIDKMPQNLQASRAVERMRRRNVFPELDNYHNMLNISPEGSFSNPEEVRGWTRFMDELSIGSAVLYPTDALAVGRMVDLDQIAMATRAYNDWMHQEYLQKDDRLQAVALLPMQEPELAAEELRRAVEELGMCGGMLPATGLQGHLGAKHYWPVHEEANRLGCCLSVHGGSYPDLGFHDLNIFAAIHAMGHPFGIMISFMSMLFNGIFDKFPNVRYGFMEGGVAWFLMALERSDGSYKAFTPLDPNRRFLQLRDGEEMREHILRHVREGRIFIGVEGDEPDLAHAVRTVGSDPFIWSSDFPHEVTVETCALEIRELVENEEVPDADLEAILWRNASRMYGLRTPAVA